MPNPPSTIQAMSREQSLNLLELKGYKVQSHHWQLATTDAIKVYISYLYTNETAQEAINNQTRS